MLNSVIAISNKTLTISGTNQATGSNMTIKVATTYAESLISGTASTFRVFAPTNCNLTLNNMTLKGGSITGGGGAIYVTGGSLTLSNVTISESRSGGGGGLAITSAATASLTNTRISGNSSTGVGGGINILGSSTLTISGITVISNNTTASDGGGISVQSGSVLNLTSCEISGNTGGNGGGLWAGGNVTFGSNVSIHDNTATGNGGGIFAYGSTSITLLTGNILSENAAKNGGGIYLSSGTQLTLSAGAEISGNSASADGGGITAASGSTLTLNSGSIFENSANNGGGLWTAVNVTLGSNVLIYDNTATGNGGGIFANGPASVTLTGNTLSGNEAKTGGGIYLTANAQLTVNGSSVISGNTASGDGGGIAAASGSILTLNGGSIFENSANNGGGLWTAVGVTLGSSVSIFNNTATGSGGGIFANGPASVTLTGNLLSGNEAKTGGGIYLTANAQLTVNGGSVISGNTASGDGGGIAAANGSTLTLSSAQITGNTGGNGGGLWTAVGVTLGSDVSISNNIATGSGGGIAIFNAGSVPVVTLNGAEITGNQAHNAGGIYLATNAQLTISGNSLINGNTATADGGGIVAMSGSTLTLTNARITGNTGGNGGGLWTAVNVTLGSNVSVSSNTATSNGGGIFIYGATTSVALSDNTLSGNSAKNGGGIYLSTGAQLTVTGSSVISANTATADGGGIVAISGSTLTLTSGQITGNTGGNGGGLWTASDVTIGSAVSISGNTATGNGGGVYAYGGGVLPYATAPNVTLSGNTLSGNEAKNGGGVYLAANTQLTLTGNSAISSNTASNDGGGIAAAHGSILTLTNGRITGNTGGNGGGLWTAVSVTIGSAMSISNNTATGNGGGINVVNSGSAPTVTLNGATVSGNEAKNGGGVYLTSNTQLTLTGNGIISGNTATSDGGGIVAAYGSTLILTNGQIIGNTGGNGGGLWLASNVTLGSNVSITGNTAAGNGGGVYVYGGGNTPYAAATSFILSNGTINDNEAAYGGGIFLSGNTAFTVNSNGAIRGNTATADGGGIAALQNVTLNLTSGTVDGNLATGNGGGIWTRSSLTVQNGFSIVRNEAGGYGGGIYASTPAIITITDGTIGGSTLGNTAQYGGGIAVRGGAGLVMNNSSASILYNTASVSGGGVYIGIGSTFSLSAGLIGNNAAVDGGGVYAAGAQNFTGGTFLGNSASNDGGAIYAASDVTVTGVAFGGAAGNGNTADGNGGAIYAAGTVTISDSGFAYNTAKLSGGAVYATGAGKLTVNSSNFTYNESYYGNSGGAVYTLGAADISDDYFANNTAHSGNGGAAYVGGDLTMELTTMIHNTATTGSGGAVWAGGASVSMRNSLIADNTAAVSGGGIYLNNAAVVASLVNLTIASNTAGASGGGIYAANGTNALVYNSILWGNKANNAYNQSANIANANFYFSGIQGWTGTHEWQGNINLQAANSGTNAVGKYYVEFDANYKLTANSYAINRGDNSYVLSGETDLAKAVRIFNAANGGRVDMGAYESNLKGNLIVVMDSMNDIIYGNNGTMSADRDGYATGSYTYSSGNTNYVTVSGDQATAVKAKGDAIVMTAAYAGDDNWNASSGTTTVNTLVRHIEVKAADAQYQYDGKYHEFDWDKTDYKPDFAFTDTVTSVNSPSYRDVGTHTDKLTGVTIKNAGGNDMTDNYEIVYLEGTMIITKAVLMVTAESANITYDGKYHNYSYDPTQVNGLISGDGITEATINSFRSAGTHDNILGYVVVKNAAGEDMTGNYDVRLIDGTVIIGKIVLEVTAQSDNRTYDGKYHDYSWDSHTDMADGDEITEATVNSFRNAGTHDNALNYVVIKNAADEDMTGNYDVRLIDGTVIINKARLTVTAESAHITYDSKYHNYSYDPNQVNGLIDGDGVTEATVNSFRNAGTYDNALDYVIVRNGNGEDMTGNYEIALVDGTVIIDKAQLILNRDGVDKVYDGTAKGNYTFSYDDTAKPLPGDKVYYDKGTATFADKNVGADKALTVTGDSLYGEDLANYDVIITDPTASITPARLIIVIDDKTKREGQADPEFTWTDDALEGDNVSGIDRSNKSEAPGRYSINEYQVNDGNNGQNYIVEVHYGTLTITDEGRINIYMDASSRNYVINGMDEASLIESVMNISANRDMDAVLETETSADHHSISHQTVDKASARMKNNAGETSLRLMFAEYNKDMVIRDSRLPQSGSDVFSARNDKGSITDSQFASSKKEGTSTFSRNTVSQAQTVSDGSLDFTGDSTHPMNTMPSSINIDGLVNEINFNGAELTNVNWQEKVENFKDRLDVALEELITV